MTPECRIPSHPGEILQHEFLEPLAMSSATFAEYLGVSVSEIDALLRQEMPVTPSFAWLLGMATGTGPELWMDLQTNHDLARNRPRRTLAKLGG